MSARHHHPQSTVDITPENLYGGREAPHARVMGCGRMEDPSAPRWLVVAHTWGDRSLAITSLRDARRHDGSKIDPQVYSPNIRVLVPQSNRPAVRQIMPAWAGYLLCMVPADDWHHLTRCRGVAEVLARVGDRQSPAWLPDEAVGRFLAMTSPQGVIEEWSAPERLPVLPVGAEVAITRGPMAGHVARVMLSSEERVALLLQLMGREVRTTVERRAVEVVNAA